jgi:hypothetical protein
MSGILNTGKHVSGQNNLIESKNEVSESSESDHSDDSDDENLLDDIISDTESQDDEKESSADSHDSMVCNEVENSLVLRDREAIEAAEIIKNSTAKMGDAMDNWHKKMNDVRFQLKFCSTKALRKLYKDIGEELPANFDTIAAEVEAEKKAVKRESKVHQKSNANDAE